MGQKEENEQSVQAGRKRVKNEDIGLYIKKLDNRIERYIHSLYDRKKTGECSLMNMRVADFLFHQGDEEVFQKDIEAEFSVNRATASKMLALMEEKDLISRTSSGTDARLKRVELRPKGVELHNLYSGIRTEMEEKLIGKLTEEEIVQFRTLCVRILSGMEE